MKHKKISMWEYSTWFTKVVLIGLAIILGVTWTIFLFTGDLFMGIYANFMLSLFGFIYITEVVFFRTYRLKCLIKEGKNE